MLYGDVRRKDVSQNPTNQLDPPCASDQYSYIVVSIQFSNVARCSRDDAAYRTEFLVSFVTTVYPVNTEIIIYVMNYLRACTTVGIVIGPFAPAPWLLAVSA